MKQMPALLDHRQCALQANTEQQHERAAGEAPAGSHDKVLTSRV